MTWLENLYVFFTPRDENAANPGKYKVYMSLFFLLRCLGCLIVLQRQAYPVVKILSRPDTGIIYHHIAAHGPFYEI